MLILKILFIVGVLTIFYTFFGYGIIIFLINKFKYLKKRIPRPINSVIRNKSKYENFPKVSLIVSASGESKELINEKISNIFKLKYPKEKLEIFFAIAYDTESQVDQTMNAYLDNFLENPEISGTNSKDEELYFRFEKFDIIYNIRENNQLTIIAKLLYGLNINSSEITLNGKTIIDKYKIEKESSKLKIFITKDIIRKGKIAQVNRTIKKASGDIILFSDANSMLNEDAVINIVRHFNNNQVGCVAGEKRIKGNPNSTSEGEGLYWKYESFLKKNDSKLWTTIGAAGEIFAVRKELILDRISENAIIEDFILSMHIAKSGYKIIYEPEAYAEENPTYDIKSEYIRRCRIAAGGFQSIIWLKELLNIKKYKILTFQYFSHRVLRWAVVPFLLPFLLIINMVLTVNSEPIFSVILYIQFIFYSFTLIGLFLEKRRIKIKIFNLPLYFSMMNYAALVGFTRFLFGNQSVIWEKVKR